MGWSLRGFIGLVCVWMLCVLSVACRVCRVLLVCAARKALQVLMAGMVLMVRLVSAANRALQVLPARKVHRGSVVSAAPPV